MGHSISSDFLFFHSLSVPLFIPSSFCPYLHAILCADQVHVGFEDTSYIVLEDAQEVETCVSVSSPERLQWAFNLTVITVDGSASQYGLGRAFGMMMMCV